MTHSHLSLLRASSPHLPRHNSQSDGMILLSLAKLMKVIGLQTGPEVHCAASYPTHMLTTFQGMK